MLEKNRHILQDLLRKLPEYQPPDAVWEGIDLAFSSPSPSGLNQLLPIHTPPDSVWLGIESSLDYTVTRRSPARRAILWIAGAAASVAVLVWFLRPETIQGASEASVTFSYGKEIVDNALLARDWQQDEEAFALVERMCAVSAFTCSNPDMHTLRAELDELTSAKTALETALGQYGTDVDLIGQLTEIERQRTVILKKILEYFI